MFLETKMGDEERKSDIIRKLEKIKNFESKATARSKFRLNQVPPSEFQLSNNF